MKMNSRVLVLAVVSAVMLVCGGCVSSGTYQAKEQESLQFSKNLEETKSAYSDLKEKSKKLSADNDALILKLKMLEANFAEIKADNDKLKLENERLSSSVRPENLLKTLGESISILQTENAILKKALISAEKSVPKKEPEPPVKLNPVVIKPAANVDEVIPNKLENPSELPK